MKRDAFKELVAANDAIGIAIIVFKLKVFINDRCNIQSLGLSEGVQSAGP
jgi:hypothetical protein